MEQPSSRENVRQNPMEMHPLFVKNVSKTEQVALTHKESVPSFLETAKATGYEVKIIPHTRKEIADLLNERWRKPSLVKLRKEEYVEVSIEGPEGSENSLPFWEALDRIEQDNAHSPSKSTTRS